MHTKLILRGKKWIVYLHYFLRKSNPPELSERLEAQLLHSQSTAVWTPNCPLQCPHSNSYWDHVPSLTKAVGIPKIPVHSPSYEPNQGYLPASGANSRVCPWKSYLRNSSFILQLPRWLQSQTTRILKYCQSTGLVWYWELSSPMVPYPSLESWVLRCQKPVFPDRKLPEQFSVSALKS